MAAHVPPEVVGQVNKELQSTKSVNQRLDAILGILEASNLAYKIQLKPQALLVHPANRSGQMVNPHDAWTKGMALVQVGIQKAKLEPDSLAMEMSTHPEKKAQQVQMNQQLVDGAQGALAPINQQERFLAI